MRRKKTRTPTFDQAFDQLVTEISQFEQTFAESTSSLLPKKRKTLAQLQTKNLRPAFHKSVLRSLTMKKEKEDEKLAYKGERCSSPETDRKAAGIPHRLPILPVSRLGPGCYNTQTQRLSPAGLFLRAPRFPMTYQEKIETYQPHVRELTPEEKRELSLRIRDNISAVKRYTPEERLKTLQSKAALEESRSSLTRLLRTEIVESTRRRREEDLDNKLRRFQWRMKADEISKGKNRWAGLVCAVSALSLWMRKHAVRKVTCTQALHERSQRVLKLLLQVSTCVGKICVRLRHRRRLCALAVLRRLCPFVARWTIAHRKALLERIALTIESSISQDIIYGVVTIQRNVKMWLLQRRLHKHLMVSQWEKFERNNNRPKSRKAGGYVVKETKVDGNEVPTAVKLVLVSELLKERVKQYSALRLEWKEQCRAILHKRAEMLDEDPLLHLPPVEFPPAPGFVSMLSEQELAGLAVSAEKKRSRWERMTRKPSNKPKQVGLLSVP